MKYVWDREHKCFVDPKTRLPMDLPAGNKVTAPLIQSDLPAYMSPLGTGLIDGRRARREDLKRNNCREVEPSEFRPEKWGRHDGTNKRQSAQEHK